MTAELALVPLDEPWIPRAEYSPPSELALVPRSLDWLHARVSAEDKLSLHLIGAATKKAAS